MSSRRLLKAAEAIREVVSMAILTEIRDPRVKDVTVLQVEVSPDMREAKVRVSVMGNENQQKLTMRGLANSAGFLQAQIAKRIDTRYTPRLTFVLDDGVKKSIEVAKILQKIAEERAGQTATPQPDDRAEDEPGLEVSANDASPSTHEDAADAAHEEPPIAAPPWSDKHSC